MNQIITQNKEQLVLLDSCVIIEGLQSKNILLVIIKKMHKYKSKLILPEIVLEEVSRKTGLVKNSLVKIIYNYFGDHLVLQENDEMREQSISLKDRYYECHFPDSLILAMCKVIGATLVTIDRKLLRTASLEGVLAFTPSNFVRSW